MKEMKNTTEIFQDVLKELGFADYKPSQMTNSDYFLCTYTAMERYASQFRQEWIPVEERLPEEDGVYDVTVMSSLVPVVVSVSYSSKLKTFRIYNVIAWKHKTPPYNPTKS